MKKTNTKIMLLGFLLLVSMNFISAASGPSHGSLDLFYLFVENVFGNLALAGLGFVVIFAVIGMVSRMSEKALIFILILFGVTFGAGYVGAAFAAPVFILALIYVSSAVINYIDKSK